MTMLYSIDRYFKFSIQYCQPLDNIVISYWKNGCQQPPYISDEYKRAFKEKLDVLLTNELCVQYQSNFTVRNDMGFSWAAVKCKTFLFRQDFNGTIEMVVMRDYFWSYGKIFPFFINKEFNKKLDSLKMKTTVVVIV